VIAVLRNAPVLMAAGTNSTNYFRVSINSVVKDTYYAASRSSPMVSAWEQAAQ